MGQLNQPALVTAWNQTHVLPGVVAADKSLSAGSAVDHREVLTLSGWISLATSYASRDAAYATLLHTAVVSALDAVAVDHDAADASRTRALAMSIAVLVLTAIAGLLLVRFIARSLQGLARQALLLDEGTFVEVTVAGPREVRTIGHTLTNAVRTLHRVQQQAQAVADGELGDVSLAAPLPGRLGEVVHASVQRMVQSLREREELQSALVYQAAHDSLTDLPNRAQAQRLTEAALHRGRRAGSPTGLLFVDLDGFKAVNDVFGHACGDDVLRTVARRLRETVRIGDTVARLGGDEFVVLVESLASEPYLVDLADRLIAAVSAPIATAAAREPVTVGASVGVAVAVDGEIDVEELFARADAAGYRAKELGRGRWELFDEPLRAQLAERAEVEHALAIALAEDELSVHYQPVFDIADGRLAGYEALVRWTRPGHGLIPPDRFIPIAEQSRLICEVDRWVLTEVAAQMQRWRTSGVPDLGTTVAVNISGRHLVEPRIVDDVREALAASGLPARCLVLEVTETVIVDNPVALENLASLRVLGVSTAIDDFGTGYTSIGQLGHLPVDTVKIDRSFVASPDAGQQALVPLMIQVAHNLGLTVVAEGVEDQRQLDQLRAYGCDQVQGYLLARPMPADEVPAFSRSGVRSA